ncbi:MAG: sodium:calcium antiporter [Gammaproteobacteria bacterium]|nr:sodium:calcium antiporter [Gammaproteobacteria bacterium]
MSATPVNRVISGQVTVFSRGSNSMSLEQVPLGIVIGILAAAAAVIGVTGTLIARFADELAVRTGLGEAVMGAVFIGASTSLPGIVTSMTAAAEGYPQLAAGNALGGIAVQIAFLCVADLAYRKANLEYAAASVANLLQGVLLVALLALPLIAVALPPFTIAGVSPVSLLIVAGYLAGLKLITSAGERPIWRPLRTRGTQREENEKPGKVRGSTRAIWMRFAVLAVIMIIAGYAVSADRYRDCNTHGLSETAVGALFTAVVTSLPELVIAVAAVRQGALNLAVGDIIGGNCFDVLFLAASDMAYREASLYRHFSGGEVCLTSASILMTAILLLGMLYRQKQGFAGIGFESALILLIYLTSVIVIVN